MGLLNLTSPTTDQCGRWWCESGTTYGMAQLGREDSSRQTGVVSVFGLDQDLMGDIKLVEA